MQGPLVSVVIPTFNRANILCSTVESVIRQTYENIEIIVVDDGSTDETQDKLAAYRNKISILQQENYGPSHARNRGIEIAKGEIVAFLDSDDTWLPNKIERQVSLFEKAGESVPCCLCNAIIRDSSGRETLSFDLSPLKTSICNGIWLNPAQVLATRCVLFTQAIAVRRDALLRVGLFDESLLLMEDYEMALKLSFQGPWVYTKEPLVIYNQSFEGLSGRARTARKYYLDSLARLYENTLNNDELKCEKTRKWLERSLKMIRRESRMLPTSKTRLSLQVLESRIMHNLTRIQNSLFRRSPWFPKMKCHSIEQWSVAGKDKEI
jgi:glycosyltransferase involved in cell wall biosynthesis